MSSYIPHLYSMNRHLAPKLRAILLKGTCTSRTFLRVFPDPSSIDYGPVVSGIWLYAYIFEPGTRRLEWASHFE